MRHTAAPAGDTPEVMAAPASVRVIRSRIKIESVAFKISITNGASVRAYGGYHSQAIGYGYRPTDYTGYGITLELDDSIFLWAQNVDYYQPALVAVTNYDDAPISYSSTSRYLTAYTDVDKNASAPASHQAPGYLGKPSAGVDETLDWKFDSMANNVRVGPVTVIDQVFGLNGNWATLCELKPVVISLADIIIYVGGAGYESVVTDLGGNVVNTASDGLPEPGFIIELPLDVDQALKTAAGAPLDEPLDLSDYLSFAYSDAAGTTRTWSLERYDAKEGNSSMADGRYIYRIVPAKGQDPIRLAFTDEEGHRSNSDDFEIELEDLYQIYDMTIYAGALNADFFRAVITFPDKRIREMKVGVQSAKLTIRGVTLDEDPTTTIRTVAPTEPVDNFTAQVEPDTLFYINKSPLEVENYNAVKLLADEIVSEHRRRCTRMRSRRFPPESRRSIRWNSVTLTWWTPATEMSGLPPATLWTSIGPIRRERTRIRSFSSFTTMGLTEMTMMRCRMAITPCSCTLPMKGPLQIRHMGFT